MLDFLKRPLASITHAFKALSDWVQTTTVDLRKFLFEAIFLAAEIYGIIHLWPHITHFFKDLMTRQMPSTFDFGTIVLVLALLWVHQKGLRKHLSNCLAFAVVRNVLEAAMTVLGLVAVVAALVISFMIGESGLTLAFALAIIWFCLIGFVTMLAICISFVRTHAQLPGSPSLPIVPADGEVVDLRGLGYAADLRPR